jgi:hypothetical protein
LTEEIQLRHYSKPVELRAARSDYPELLSQSRGKQHDNNRQRQP